MLADEHRFGSLLGETLERQFTRKGGDSTAYNFQGWYGTTYNRLALKAEGAISNGKLEESRTELLWARAIASYWDTQVGVRLDSGEGPSRQWLAFGTVGLAAERSDFPDIQQHLLVRVVVLHLDQRPRGGNGNAQLFLQFTVQGRGHAFTRLHLAAGELPQSTLMLLIGTLGQQDVAIGTANHCRRYMYSLHHEGSSRAACNHRWKAGHW